MASHFVGDLLVHVGDLPVMAAQGPKLGLGLWANRPLALVVESGLFGAGALYWWWPRRNNPGGAAVGLALAALTAFAAITFFIPTPPSPDAMALTGLATYVGLAFVARWMDRSSAPRSQSINT